MKANELMIGDWVIYDHNVFEEDEYMMGQHPLEPHKIESGESIDLAIEGCFSPLPLTLEILEKNGFKYSDESLDYILRNRIDIDNVWSITAFESRIKQGWCIDVSFSHLNYSESVHKIIKYVHELQHALRLCGLNELADNFKV